MGTQPWPIMAPGRLLQLGPGHHTMEASTARVRSDAPPQQRELQQSDFQLWKEIQPCQLGAVGVEFVMGTMVTSINDEDLMYWLKTGTAHPSRVLFSAFYENWNQIPTSTRSEEWQAALAIFCQMPDYTLDHSIGAYSAMISACHLAILLLSRMGETEQHVIFMGKRGNMIISLSQPWDGRVYFQARILMMTSWYLLIPLWGWLKPLIRVPSASKLFGRSFFTYLDSFTLFGMTIPKKRQIVRVVAHSPRKWSTHSFCFIFKWTAKCLKLGYKTCGESYF